MTLIEPSVSMPRSRTPADRTRRRRGPAIQGPAIRSTATRGCGWARTLPVGFVLCLAMCFAATGCGALDRAGPSTDAGGATGRHGQVITVGAAVATLQSIPVHPATASPRYRRDEFGPAWADVDDNGCDTRNDILHRDLTLVTTKRNSCIVLTGELKDPYTNRTIRFDRSRAADAVQIDHVVALADAWRTGAAFWSPDKRLAFANDPENLLAVNGPTNQDKSDDDASQWLPPNRGYRCRYVARQIGVKARYGLWVDATEREAMIKILSGCPTQPVFGAAQTH
ncbi:HNH endonuclease family protein [Protofrankia symbiont of Coriaria ruscifolia]|uniref:HNH endonuclease family protein n=1 Tax=Protofrankia symbiont of Coriaria ruscifolia TaxID=1306542 RepID=UPI001F5F6B72|nr:HNH endonuclease family protein [Protofrankia symbiont of Coriaria ruscifolia]